MIAELEARDKERQKLRAKLEELEKVRSALLFAARQRSARLLHMNRILLFLDE